MLTLDEWTGQEIRRDMFGVIHTVVWFDNEEHCSCGWGWVFTPTEVRLTYKGNKSWTC